MAPPSTAPARESRLSRALYALPILGLAGLMGYAFSMGEPIAPIIMDLMERSVFDLGGVNVPLIKDFYGLSWLDEFFAHVTVAFAQLQFNVDKFMYLHSLVFLTDFAGIYVILLLESCRAGNKATWFQFPLALLLPGQFIAIGILGPIYFYFFYVFTPMEKLSTVRLRSMNAAYSLAVLPVVVVAYLLPHFGSYLDPSLKNRHWWNWVWQLYPVWGSAVFFAIATIISSSGVGSERALPPTPQLLISRSTVGVFALISTIVYWYAIYTSDWSVPELFVPQYFLTRPQEGLTALRTIIQFDYISTFGAALLWLAYSFRDLKAADKCDISWARTLWVAFVIGLVFGPGTLVLIGWIAREHVLTTSDYDEDKKDI